MALFTSSVQDALKKLNSGLVSSSGERDELLQVVLENPQGLKPGDVVWMLFRPDRSLRAAAVTLLGSMRDLGMVDVFLAECRGKPEAALRSASGVLFGLKIRGVEDHLAQRLNEKDEQVKEAIRQVVFGAPPSRGLAPLLWRLASAASGRDRIDLLERLAEYEISPTSLTRWRSLAHDEDRQVRETALMVLAKEDCLASVDLIVEELPRTSYGPQQQLIESLAGVAATMGPDFADRILPLMASGDAGTRSAVIKVLLGMDHQSELIKRYISFSKTLAGWARDRALDSMREFGAALVEPTIELLADPDEDVRGSALVVAGFFNDPRIVPATIGLLNDPDWWVRITAADTLGRIGDSRAVGPLVAALEDSDAKWAAVEALGRIGDERSLQALSRLLKDPAIEVRIEVLLALRNFKHPKILEVLKNVAAKDPARIVRARALEIAEQVAERDQLELADASQLRIAALRSEIHQDEPRLHALLVGTRNQGASDLHLSVGMPPVIRLAADLVRIKGGSLTAEQTIGILKEILTDDQWARLHKEKQLDFCYFVPSAGRYRGNIFFDQKGLNAVFRVIPEQPPTIAEIGLPHHMAEIADYHQGLVLVCGPAGSGKSTTLAALVNLFNETRNDHVITMEDPVEFVHPFKNCLINQREVGSHTRTFARALRAALREDPDVIVIGDLRDTESVSLALTAAETGHIVLGTLNSTTAHKAVDRIIAAFDADEQPQIRTSLAESLKYVIAQRLLPSRGPERQVAVFEILKGTTGVCSLIREEKSIQIPSAMQMGKSQGMQTFDDAISDLVKAGLIDPEVGYMAATAKEDFEGLVSAEFLESQTFV